MKPVPKAQNTEARLNTLIATATGWQTFGSMSNGWSVGGHAKYRLTMDGLLVLAWKSLNVGTITDNTTIWSSANGLASGFRPVNTSHLIVVATDHMSNPGGTGSESAGALLNTDGSVTIFGMSGSATRVDAFITVPLDD
jgi:hypothetical protein